MKLILKFKQVLDELQIKLIYALSPQAKGKIERPYGWLQDRIVRTCAREGIADINDARQVLASELKRYNSYQVRKHNWRNSRYKILQSN